MGYDLAEELLSKWRLFNSPYASPFSSSGPEGQNSRCRGRQASVRCRTNAGAPEGRHLCGRFTTVSPRWGSFGIRRTNSGASRHRLGLLRPSGPTASTASLAPGGRNTIGINTCNLNFQFFSRQDSRNFEWYLPCPCPCPMSLVRGGAGTI